MVTQPPTIDRPGTWTSEFCFAQAHSCELTDFTTSRAWKLRGFCLEQYEKNQQNGQKQKHPYNGMRVDVNGKELPIIITEQIRETLLGQCLNEHYQLRTEE